MKRVRAKRIFLLVVAYLCFITAFADEFYVSVNGGGNGSDAGNAATLSQLQTKLDGIVSSGIKKLDVYWEDGVYTVNNVIDIPLSAGLEVTFQPLTEGSQEVRIFGNATAGPNTGRFLNLAAGTTSNNMTVTVKGFRLMNFSSTGSGSDITGDKSLLTILAYNTLVLENVIFYNISSNRNPLMTLTTGATMKATGCQFLHIQKLSSANNDYAIYETAAGHTNTSLIFENCVFDGWKGGTGSTYSHMFWMENDFNVLSFTDCSFSNNTTNNSMIRSSHAGVVTVAGCKFYQNNFTNQSSSSLFYTTGSTVTRFYNNSIYNNQFSRILYLSGGNSAAIYNNTFSGNSSSYSIYSGSSGNNAIILNNTIYNSGQFYLNNTSCVVKNNLVLGTSIIYPNSNTIGNIASRNISNGRYYEGNIPAYGASGGITINNLSHYWDSQLTVPGLNSYGEEKPPVHALLRWDLVSHPILRMGNNTGYEELIKYDQRGSKRPPNAGISIGAWDIMTLYTNESKNLLLYDPKIGIENPGFMVIDLSTCIDLPENATYDDISIGFSGELTNGSLEKINEYTYCFYPNTDPSNPDFIDKDAVGEKSLVMYTVTYADDSIPYTFVSTNELSVTIVDIGAPLGLIDESLYECYADFYAGSEFLANYKFNSQNSGENFYGFTIPLVGDLNGDGYPEIISMRAGTGMTSNYTHLTILNGQTGEFIADIPLGSNGLNVGTHQYSYGYHGSPCTMVLVDSDRNGKGEIVLATTNSNMPTYLYSYEINDKTFLPASELSISSADRLTLKWVSDMPYTVNSESDPSVHTDNAFRQPIPQVADIDGDGYPEIIVYNKIYDAQSGQLKIIFDELGPLNTYTSTTASISTYKEYAYLGRNRIANNSASTRDIYQTFYSIYDLDMDGKYEIIAGGKVYYDLDVHKTGGSNWKVKSADHIDPSMQIGDGYTAVADINGDGKAEIVVVKLTDATAARSIMRIQVWDPGFVEWNQAESKWVPVSDPAVSSVKLLAQLDVPTYRGYYPDEGTMSFVYIGDIDGYVTENEKGVPVKLPEISILSGAPYSSAINSTYNTSIPIHPTVEGFHNIPVNSSGFVAYTNSIGGALASFTWDETGTDIYNKLKVSFLLEHKDMSKNTGFTFFDFDNDGCQDICYRDEETIRIISPREPYVSISETPDTKPHIIRFKQSASSYTGFEYPVIADIDNDGSADLVFMGRTNTSRDQYHGYVHAVQADPNVSKFAPAPTVWNQFHYSPLKINEDLTTPFKNLHPLDPKYGYIKNAQTPEADDYMVKDFIYNNLITQVPKYRLIDIEDDNSQEMIVEWKAIMPVPEASISTGTIDIANSQASFYVKNSGDAALNGKQLIAVYRDFIGAPDEAGTKKSGFLGTFPISETEDVRPGDSLFVTYSLFPADLYDKYIFRVLDASYYQDGVFYPGFLGQQYCPDSYFDCKEDNNTITLSTFAAVDDIRTVLQYSTITIPVFENDLYPESLCPVLKLDENELILPSGNGDFGNVEVSADGKSLIYTAPANYPGVVEIGYKLKCEDNESTGYVYIYVVESCTNSFSVCYGENFDICLVEKPDGTTFRWFSDAEGISEIPAPGSVTITNAVTYYVKPEVSAPYDNYSFPIVAVTITPANNGIDVAQMKWTGAVNTDWNNPGNWLMLENGNYVPVNFVPNTCVDVILPGGLDRYPMITDSSWVNNISVKNRALIAGTHLLNYNEASVEINFKSNERDRWVMYSAPLRKTYSGDYMLVDYTIPSAPKPIYRAVYMSFFQSANPDYPNSVAVANAFTKSFANLGEHLMLGKPFNVWIDTDFDTGTPFVFPSPFDQYSYDVHGPWSTDLPGANAGDSLTHVFNRKDENGTVVSGRFIVEDKPGSDLDPDGGFRLKMPDDNADFSLIMVPNPFMAYLDMDEFILRNNNSIESGYKIWKGTDDDFISYHYSQASWYDRVWIVDKPEMIVNALTPRYVAPLQSFMVLKKYAGDLPELIFSPSMTVTEIPSDIAGDYQLRNIVNNDPAGLIRITATSGNLSNSTVLVNAPGAPNSYGYEDSRKVFYDYELSGYKENEIGNSLMVYTLTPEDIPLAINMMGDFSEDVPVGIRLNFSGLVRFDFTGADHFGYDLYFKDGNTVVDLKQTPVYTTEVNRPANSTGLFYEINNRFSLNITGSNTEIEERGTIKNSIRMATGDGMLFIESAQTMEAISIYSVMGSTVYTSRVPSANYQINSLQRGQVFIVKISTATGQEIKKVTIR